jgi:hypothetical protein
MTRLRGTDDMAQPGSCLSKRLSDRRAHSRSCPQRDSRT